MIYDEKFNKGSIRKKILVAPLEWGLGHATRCIPVISQLIHQHCDVYIAAEGATYALLKTEFPQLSFLSIRGYRMKYSRKKYFLPLKILLQLPKIVFTIYNENKWLKKIVKEYKINAVISDNRFGMYNSEIPSVYITHQLSIKTGNGFTEQIANKIHYYFINKYSKCWVPDFEKNGLAGDLSHPKKLPGNTQYIGTLSRFKMQPETKTYDLLISISGPEPQRTLFENKILGNLKSFSGKTLFIRGLPDNADSLTSENKKVEIKNHLSSEEFNKAILQSEMIVSRCGYTTVMDLIKLKKRAILIPTPGQTEQEYLAGYLMQNKMFYTIPQQDFELEHVLKQASEFNYTFTEYNMEYYKRIIDEFVESL